VIIRLIDGFDRKRCFSNKDFLNNCSYSIPASVHLGHWFRLMGYIVRNAHSAGIAAILEVSRQNPYFEGILSIFPITRNQCRTLPKRI
jgi:hypothetical protein